MTSPADLIANAEALVDDGEITLAITLADAIVLPADADTDLVDRLDAIRSLD